MKSTPKATTVFKGIKGMVASGPGKTKSPAIANLHRPEGAVKIDAGNVTPRTSVSKTAAGSPMSVGARGAKLSKGIHIGVRPEPAIKRDGADVVKPK